MKNLRFLVVALLVGVSSVAYAQDPEPTTPPEAPPTPEVTADTPAEPAVEEPAEPEVTPEPTPEPKPEPKSEPEPAAQPEPASEPAATDEEAPQGPEFEFSARVRPRLILRANNGFGLDTNERNYNRGNTYDFGTLQARLGAKAHYGDLTGNILLQYAGRNGLFGGNELTDPAMGIHVATADWQAHEAVALQMGRFEMNYGAQRIIGSVGYHQVGRAFDGGRVFIKPSKKLSVDLFLTKYVDELLPEGDIFNGDAFFTGAYATYKDTWGLIDFYALYDRQSRADGEGTQRGLATVGARGKGGISWVNLEVEGAIQPGVMCAQGMGGCTDEDIDIFAWFVDTELWIAKPKVNTIKGFIGFGIASGDDPETEEFEAFNHMYSTPHKWLGRMDIIGTRTNIQEIRAGIAWKYWITKGKLSYHDFSRLQPEAERVGGEVDLTVWFHLTEGLDFEAVYGVFLPGDGVSNSDTSPEGVAHWSSLTAVAKF